METIKNYIRLYPVRCVLVVNFIVLFVVGIGCYTAGRQSAERDFNLSRVQTTERQLESARSELSEAVRANQSARDITTDSIVVNNRIEQSIDRSASAISRSEAANERTSAAVDAAQQLVREAKRTAEQDTDLIADSKRILERAVQRNKRTAIEAEKE